MNQAIEKKLLKSGATVVGFAMVRDALNDDIAHLSHAISIGVDRNLNDDTISLLSALQTIASQILKENGNKYLCIPPDSDRISGTFISRLYPLFTHKIAATASGLGWIGRNGLLISPEYGPRLSLATVLTDAHFEVGRPAEFSLCGDCSLCAQFCPSGAITGKDWSRFDPLIELVRFNDCSAHKKSCRPLNGKPTCGLCVNICPYGRRNYSYSSDKCAMHS